MSRYSLPLTVLLSTCLLSACESSSNGSTLGSDINELTLFSSNAYDMEVKRSTDDGSSWGSTTFVTPNTTASNGDYEVYYPHAAHDGDGNIVVVWQTEYIPEFGGEYDVAYSVSNDNGRTWSDLSLLNPADTVDSESDESPKVATDGEGNWVAVWVSDEDIESSGTDSDIVFVHSTNNGTTWSSPKTVNSFAASDSAQDWSPNIYMTDSRWVVVWMSSQDLDGGAQTDRDIVVSYSTDLGVTWSTPEYVNSDAAIDTETDYFPILDMNENGFGVVAWSGKNSTDDDLDIYQATTSDFGETWSTKTIVNGYGTTDTDNDHDYPSFVEVNEDNEAVISWYGEAPANGSEDDVYYSYTINAGANWSTEVALNPNADTDTEQNEALHIIQTPEGNWLAHWNNTGTSDTYLRTSDDLVNWSDPVVIHDDVYYNAFALYH